MFDWCKKDTLCKLRGNQGELVHRFDDQKEQVMHRMRKEMWVTPLLHGWKFVCCAAMMACGLSSQGQLSIDPPGWWGNLEEGRVEVLVSGRELGHVQGVQCRDRDAKLESWRPASMEGHVWVNLDVSEVQTSKDILLVIQPEQGRVQQVSFHVQPQLNEKLRLDEWEAAPAMYLIMPDRFANGAEDNDDVDGMLESGVDRAEMYRRHGGDLRGVTSRLDYLGDLGVGAIWLTPVVENDLSKTSYHGYACTDSYRVDPRLGTLEDYKDLAEEAHKRGIRVVHDWVPNHWGLNHRLLTHPVDSNWVHNWEGEFDESKRTNYRSGVVVDPHRQAADVDRFNNGWFDRMMPDMNQMNPDLQRYMGTNMLWWMAEVGIDGLRIDTYTYGQQDAMAAMTKRISKAFPECFMFSEAWVYGTAKQAALIEGTGFGWGGVTGLDGAVDFAWHFAMQEAVHQGEGWERGIGAVYEVLADDFLYPDPNRLVTFLDNHDTHRWIAEAGGNVDKAKAGLAMLLMGRGMPCLYYGTELGFDTRCEPDGKVRQDMPGGWPDDPRNAFDANARTPKEQMWFNHIQGLLSVRRDYSGAFRGDMEHFFPKQGVYGFARSEDNSRIVTLANAASERRTLPWQNVEPWLAGASKVEELQADGTLKEVRIEPGTELKTWEHKVWVVHH